MFMCGVVKEQGVVRMQNLPFLPFPKWHEETEQDPYEGLIVSLGSKYLAPAALLLVTLY